jgi:DNA-binding XRE family transcriptional regulator
MTLQEIQAMLNGAKNTKEVLEAVEQQQPAEDIYDRNMVKEFGRTVTRVFHDENTTFAQLLELELQNSQYTIAQVADMIGTSSTSVNKWKKGKVYPAIHFAYRIAQLLHGDEWMTAFVMYARKIDKER